MALTLPGQLKLLKNTPDVFYSPPSMALTLPGQLKLLKNTPDVFLFTAIHGAHPLKGQHFALLKIAPGNFFILSPK
ncbi:hypothetical protein EIK76_10415 [Rheinheimera mesophila]|uniref:Uncharacterized protein n=2 Tax=Rheinheimera mesophila TaxID=1547515 RepID=A0A3P3QJR0_9GAMM|nr:hypothetical protein [Rheinheimera mesophila]RRJ21285.1 hypothetical protein EIK76_10415 [Rheinheimera mesophila]